MERMTDSFFDLIDIPDDARRVILNCESELHKAVSQSELSALIDAYMADPEKGKETVFPKLDEIAKSICVPEETLSWLFLALCTYRLEKAYDEKKIPHEIFVNTIYDMNYKIHECHNVRGFWGIMCRDWYPGFFNLSRFGIGRLQYDIFPYDAQYTLGGVTVNEGDTVLRIHIPSGGPLTKELRDDSYRRAYDFFKKYAKNGVLFYLCTSWLLSKLHIGLLSESSNIRSFMNDFDLQEGYVVENSGILQRIWGADASLPVNELPEKSSLMRAYKKLLLDGQELLWGRGIFAFDGENYIRSDGLHPTL